jgi:hypothetical protein
MVLKTASNSNLCECFLLNGTFSQSFLKVLLFRSIFERSSVYFNVAFLNNLIHCLYPLNAYLVDFMIDVLVAMLALHLELVGLRDGTSVFVPHASFLSRDNIGEIITDVAISSDIVL